MMWSSLFFSSRRRHTRSLCDWSSDVCSSDLSWRQQPSQQLREQGLHIIGQDDGDSRGEQGHLLPPGERGYGFHGETAILSCVCSSPSPSRARHTSRAASCSPTSSTSCSWYSPMRSILAVMKACCSVPCARPYSAW